MRNGIVWVASFNEGPLVSFYCFFGASDYGIPARVLEFGVVFLFRVNLAGMTVRYNYLLISRPRFIPECH